MFYYLYKITNVINNKIYIGIHKTASLDDSYMGSGKLIKLAIKKYGIENFKKEILEFFDNETDMILREQEIVTEDFVLSENNYNVMPGGKFGSFERNGLTFSNKSHSEETKEKIRKASKGRTHSDITKKKMSENSFSRTNPVKQKINAALAGSSLKTTEHKLKISESIKKIHKERNPNLGKKRKIVQCPHCGKEGAMNTLSRWHFNNCSAGG